MSREYVPLDLSTETRKLKLLINNYGELRAVIFHPRFLSPSKKFVRFGDYAFDEIEGWRDANNLLIVEILEVMEPEK